MRPYSLYIHIPFCIQKCAYCDFLSFPSDKKSKEIYIESLCNEIKAYSLTAKRTIDTIFIGGGTPTSLSVELLDKLLTCVSDYFYIEKTAEVTIEANPKTVTEELANWLETSRINRVSIGLQSVFEHHLNCLGRIHTFEDFIETFYRVKKAGINDINIDLMFGLPKQTFQEWVETLEKVIELGPTHISAYGLIIEEHTPFHRLYHEGKLKLPDEELERHMYHHTKELLEKHDMFQYEISNYALKGYECKHNIGYWMDKEYIGVGLGAASYLGGVRYKNTENMELYNEKSSSMDSIREITMESSRKNQLEEAIFLGLRMTEGILLDNVNRRFNNPFDNEYQEIYKRLLDQKLLIEENGHLKLSEKGVDLSNYVFSQFLLDD